MLNNYKAQFTGPVSGVIYRVPVGLYMLVAKDDLKEIQKENALLLPVKGVRVIKRTK